MYLLLQQKLILFQIIVVYVSWLFGSWLTAETDFNSFIPLKKRRKEVVDTTTTATVELAGTAHCFLATSFQQLQQ